MLALFLASSAATALLLWAELNPGPAEPCAEDPPPIEPLRSRRALATEARAAQTATSAPVLAAPQDPDALVLARLAQALAEPEPAAAETETEADPLPRIAGFRPGDVIELEIDGPLPRPEDIRFEQWGCDARLWLEGFPALILEGVAARSLRPEAIRFRSPQAA